MQAIIVNILTEQEVQTTKILTYQKEPAYISLNIQNRNIRFLKIYEKNKQIWVENIHLKITLQGGNKQKLVFYTAKHFVFEQQNCMVLFEPCDTNLMIFNHYCCEEGSALTIGRETSNDICIGNPYVSFHHATLYYEQQQFRIVDEDSSNGLYVNHKRVYQANLKSGDCVFIMGVEFYIGPNFFTLPQTHFLFLSSKVHKASIPEEKMEIKEHSMIYEPHYVFEQEKDFDVVQIELPPANYVREEIPLLLALGPSFTMGFTSIMTMLFSMQNRQSSITVLFMCVSMGLSSFLWPFTQKIYEKQKIRKKEKQRINKYKNYLENKRKEIDCYKQEEQDWLMRVHLSLMEMWEMQKQNHYAYSYTSSHVGYLSVCIGKGEKPSKIKKQMESIPYAQQEDELVRLGIQLYKQEEVLKEGIFTISFLTYSMISANTSRAWIYEVVTTFCFLHAPEQLHVILLDEDPQYCWLPHLWWKGERHVIQKRQEMVSLVSFLKYWKALETKLPLLIVSCSFELQSVIDLKEWKEIKEFLYIEQVENKQQISCFTQLFIKEENEDLLIEEIALHQKYRCKKMSVNVELEIIHKYLMNLKRKEGTMEPKETYFDLIECGSVDQLHIYEHWTCNNCIERIQGLIGVDEYGHKLYLDIHEKQHGPHGLLAGMTGSGKSEWLLVFIASLAIQYHPLDLNFLFIDYKGGGMAHTFQDLPHTVAILSNLESGMERFLESLKSEVKKRQQQFLHIGNEMGMSNIDIVAYQKLTLEHSNIQRMAHLFIIADEFAELKEQNPKMLKQLISIARIGRSLGIHLLLSTQKPSGVVDEQIWSNSRFHVCMKVQDVSDSMEMLKKADAAELKKRGEFYLQVGQDEWYMKGSAPWISAPYIEKDEWRATEKKEVYCLNHQGRVVQQVNFSLKSKTKQIDVLVRAMKETAKIHQIKVAPLMCPELPETLLFSNLREGIGYLDLPDQQKQIEYTLSLEDIQHCMIFGNRQSGKEEWVYTLVAYFQKVMQQQDLLIYICDFDDYGFQDLLAYSVVCDVVKAEETEKLKSLFYQLKRTILKRKKRKKKETVILLIMHSYELFLELFEEEEELFHWILREGQKVNCYVWLFINSIQNVRSKTTIQIKQSIAFQMNDVQDYRLIFPELAKHSFSFVYGRCLISYENKIYMMQLGIAEKQTNGKGNKHVYAIPLLPEHAIYTLQKSSFAVGICTDSKEHLWIQKEEIECLFIVYANDIAVQKYLYVLLQIFQSQSFVCSSFLEADFSAQILYGTIHEFSYVMQKYSRHKENLQLLWLGDGLQEHLYTLQLPYDKIEPLKKKYGYFYWKEERYQIQLFEGVK